jgi:hypothetical protein
MKTYCYYTFNEIIQIDKLIYINLNPLKGGSKMMKSFSIT